MNVLVHCVFGHHYQVSLICRLIHQSTLRIIICLKRSTLLEVSHVPVGMLVFVSCDTSNVAANSQRIVSFGLSYGVKAETVGILHDLSKEARVSYAFSKIIQHLLLLIMINKESISELIIAFKSKGLFILVFLL